ncbi:tripartite tricarboxylate transporter permease [Pelagibacterium halotolerans]|uniref:Tricarboxylate transport membrane protein TctA n=1 Tax=Pelagibacterium halotolerans (strain DSM 22347 / JCM 15775 / CGMCC 1.7692 / B2) TaxID=1082931 RepID=G4RD44_PELHB|nr:tripartite tricarboxylate transporter permease [Pelagibacterium halotolerans]AEQ53794.1 tricarboxylate transport membrane protein TctA [Pelagibacterium halotolerans B2]QJR20049.1 tripartite tricarboxylate transporter permease [Pelagibacterium halotolerans]SEA81155.1 putative tricarboxylic transport membrane protein [Pelagibacterium halotolerans]
MDTFALLLDGLMVAAQPMNLAFALIGVLLGTAVGVMPGIGPALTVALLLPISLSFGATGSLIMFAGIYYGGMYGGAISSILLNTPGETASIMTAVEGNKMARDGRGGKALGAAAIGSFVGGTIGTLGLALVSPFMVKVALSFGPAEYFALMVLSFVTVSAAFGGSVARGLTALFVGLAIGLVGIDKLTGQPRLAFGIPELRDNISIAIVAVGLFAIGETLFIASRNVGGEDKVEAIRGSVWLSLKDIKRIIPSYLRGAGLGFMFGPLPTGGAEIPTFLSYSAERKSAKGIARQEFESEKGAIEGVAGPEAANNASAAGTLIPLLTLGLPTSATAAMMLAGFQQYGLQPGPLLFTNDPGLVWGLVASLFLANLMLVVLNLPFVGVWVRLLMIPRPWLYAGILTFATLGTIGAQGNVFALVLLLFFGLLGFVMRRFGYPLAPVLVGAILGPLAEEQLRRGLMINRGDWSFLLTSPIALTIYAIAAAAVLGPVIWRMLAADKSRTAFAMDGD